MFRQVGLLTHIVLHPPRQYGFLDHYNFEFEGFFRDNFTVGMAENDTSVEKKMMGPPTGHSVPIDIPIKRGALEALCFSSGDSGVGLGTPTTSTSTDMNTSHMSSFEAGSESPCRSIGTQTPTRKSDLGGMHFLHRPIPWNLEDEDEVIDPATGLPVLNSTETDSDTMRASSLPERGASPVEPDFDIEANIAVGRELREVADEFHLAAEARRATIFRGRSNSLFARVGRY